MNPERDYIRDMNNFNELDETIALSFPERIQQYLKNLTSVNILCCHDRLVDPAYTEEYKRMKLAANNAKPCFKEALSKIDEKFDESEIYCGFYRVTAFGKSFLSAVVRV